VSPHLQRQLTRIREVGCRAGVALNPSTSLTGIVEVLADLELLLIMTVNPGFGHQHFLHTTLPKIRRVRQMIDRLKPGCELEVDGGINPKTAPLVVEAGATVLVAGSAIFGHDEGVAAATKLLRAAASRSAN